jgi:hypothetical protein
VITVREHGVPTGGDSDTAEFIWQVREVADLDTRNILHLSILITVAEDSVGVSSDLARNMPQVRLEWSGGAFVRWKDTPYAHLMIPVALYLLGR